MQHVNEAYKEPIPIYQETGNLRLFSCPTYLQIFFYLASNKIAQVRKGIITMWVGTHYYLVTFLLLMWWVAWSHSTFLTVENPVDTFCFLLCVERDDECSEPKLTRNVPEEGRGRWSSHKYTRHLLIFHVINDIVQVYIFDAVWCATMWL